MAAAAAPMRNSGDRKLTGALRAPRTWNPTPGTLSQRPRARREVRHQGKLQGLPRIEQLVVDAGPAKLAAVALDEVPHRLQVMRSHDRRHGHHLFLGLEILEARGTLERELELVGIEYVKDDYVGAAKLKMLEAANHLLGVVQEVRNQDDHAPLGQRIGAWSS